MKPKNWTPAEDAALKGLFSDYRDFKNPDAQIFKTGILQGRSENAIRVRRSDIGAVKHHSKKSHYILSGQRGKNGSYTPPPGTPLTLDLKESKRDFNKMVESAKKVSEGFKQLAEGVQKLRGEPKEDLLLKDAAPALQAKKPAFSGIFDATDEAAGVISIYLTGQEVYYSVRGFSPAQTVVICSKVVSEIAKKLF